jgi:hypothetical protein
MAVDLWLVMAGTSPAMTVAGQELLDFAIKPRQKSPSKDFRKNGISGRIALGRSLKFHGPLRATGKILFGHFLQ